LAKQVCRSTDGESELRQARDFIPTADRDPQREELGGQRNLSDEFDRDLPEAIRQNVQQRLAKGLRFPDM